MRQVYLQKGVIVFWLLLLPIILCCYLGLFLTMQWWYPDGLSRSLFNQHLLHFSLVYILWLIVFFIHGLFDLDLFRRPAVVYANLAVTVPINLLIAIAYFYFQPSLIITPRRFLLVHLAVTTVAMALWYAFVYYLLPRLSRRVVYAHPTLPAEVDLPALLSAYSFMGLRYGGAAAPSDINQNSREDVLVIVPENIAAMPEAVRELYDLRSQTLAYFTYPAFYEYLTRRVYGRTLSELWFLESVRFREHRWYRFMKRVIDIVVGAIGLIVFLITFPVIASLIKLTSRGPVFFKQRRVGLGGQPFWLYKYRTMIAGGVSDTWTLPKDPRITSVGQWLRKLRLDELPQAINILQGALSVVGPRPEQDQIVDQLREHIPYYHERHIVKPGLTGWGQLHVYAATLEESRQKLEYDLYYIKHRSLLFDLEIVLKTLYHILTLRGK
jgi:lipopolysaccharide/colanic/teichoic acid biosynthesis glycosyltransferase